MIYSLCSDIMFVGVGEHGPIWPDTDGIIDAMKLAKKNGLGAIEMFDLGGRDLDKLKAASEELGIAINACVSDGAMLLGDAAKTEELVNGFTATAEMAAQINCPNVILNAECCPKDLSEEEMLATMEAQLKQLVPIAEKNGVTILFEPLTGGVFTSSAQAFALVDRVGSDSVKVLYDCFHFQNIEGKITETIKNNVDKIGDIHFAGSPMRCEITVGELDYGFILNAIKESGYDKNICLEFFTFQDREAKVEASCTILN